MSIHDIETMAKSLLAEQGELRDPLVLVVGTRDQLMTPLVPVGDLDIQQQAAKVGFAVGHLHPVGDLVQLFIIAEGWMSLVALGAKPTGRPTNDPGRTAVLILSEYRAVDQQTTVVLREIRRSGTQGNIQLLPIADASAAKLAQSPLLAACLQGYEQGREAR